MLLQNNEAAWLAQVQPKLNVSPDGKRISGIVDFVAAYSEERNLFTVAAHFDPRPSEGVVLEGSFDILIEEFGGGLDMPKLFVNDTSIPHDGSRHFYSDTGAACVCGVTEGAIFLASGSSFKKYFEEMVVPFLYEQVFYEKFNKWPWGEYSHNTTGTLESYALHGSEELLYPVVRHLIALNKDWEAVKKILTSVRKPQGHTRCFCPKQGLIRDCHPEAWEGLKKLYRDFQNLLAKGVPSDFVKPYVRTS